jgi:SAM-dependent methyltransferase
MAGAVSWFGRSRPSANDALAAVEDAAAKDAVAKAEVDALKARLTKLEAQVELTERYFTEAFWNTLDVAYEAVLAHRPLTCVVCGHTAGRDGFEIREDRCYFGGGRLERYVCPGCDCVFGPQKYLDLDEAFVGRDYQVLYSRYSEGDSTENELRSFRSLNAEKAGRYLDWGAGGGWNRTLETLKGEGWDVIAHEPNAAGAADSVAPIWDGVTGGFDGLFSNNVIEHFRDPVAQFRQFHELLKPGAKMAHASPCYDYSFAFTRFHSVFLLGRSPSILAERTGFKVVDSERDGEYINYVFQRV